MIIDTAAFTITYVQKKSHFSHFTGLHFHTLLFTLVSTLLILKHTICL